MQKVLLIDDSKSIHPLVTSLLEEEPVTIHSAFDAQSGVLLAESLRPDLVLLDVEMPGIDGYAACQSLKANPATAGVPVVFLTARSATESVVRGLNLGAMDYVAKPFQPSELLSRVRAALRTSHLIRLLEEKATIDALTGLGNRAMLEDRVAAELAMRVRTHGDLSCILLDVDRFKTINDRFGHPFGDQVLRTIGEQLVDICRREDVACRHGGDEFAILTPQTSSAHAALLAERMRAAISEISFTRGGETVAVTCSFGIAEATHTYDRCMLQRADQALYQSKSKGANCVSIAPTQSDDHAIAA